MPTNPCPAAARLNDVGVIQIQSYHGGSSYRSQTSDFAAICAPIEMLSPRLFSGMKQWSGLASQRILNFDLRPFEFVTSMAG
jgi:hypothetical protein